MSNYLFVYKAASCGGHCIAIFPEEKIADALDYIVNSPNSKFMHLYQGEWDVASEIPIAKLKSIEHPLDCGWWKDCYNCSCGVIDK